MGQDKYQQFRWRLKSIGSIANHDSQWKEIFEFYGYKWENWWDDYCEGLHNLVGSFTEDGLKETGNRFYSSIFGLEGENFFIKWLYGGNKKDLKPFYKWFIGYMERKKEESVKRIENQKQENIEQERQKEKGYIYLLKSRNLYKIGRAKDLKNRIITYQTENPFGIKIIFQKEVNDYIGTEKRLLNRFEDRNHRGEWFKLNKEDIEWIKGNV